MVEDSTIDLEGMEEAKESKWELFEEKGSKKMVRSALESIFFILIKCHLEDKRKHTVIGNRC